MPLPIPPRVALKMESFSRPSSGATRVILVLADGRRIENVAVAWNSGIVKIGNTAVSSTEDLDFRLTDVVDARPYVGPWPTLTRRRFFAVLVASGMLGATPGLLAAYSFGGLPTFSLYTFAALAISAPLFYASACRRLRTGAVPWPQCMGVILVAYVWFGLFWAVSDYLRFSSQGISHFLVGWSIGFHFALLFAGWTGLPVSALVAAYLARSNNSRYVGGTRRGGASGKGDLRGYKSENQLPFSEGQKSQGEV